MGLTAGGVHSNPRINTWYGGVGGLTEVPSGLDLYGGDEAVALSRIAGGAPGFVIAGQRSSGAVAWVSPDGAGFTRIVADLDRTSAAADAAAVDRGWLLVGSRTPAGAPRSARDPAAWYSADGGRTWRAEAPPSTVDEDEALSRVVPLSGGGALAVGVRGTGFGAWRRVPGSGWRAVGRFGRFGGTAVPVVSGLAGTPDGHVYAAVSDGSGYQLWSTADGGSWRRLDVPVRLPAGPGRRLLVAGDGARLLLGAQDGRTARLWLAQRGS